MKYGHIEAGPVVVGERDIDGNIVVPSSDGVYFVTRRAALEREA